TPRRARPAAGTAGRAAARRGPAPDSPARVRRRSPPRGSTSGSGFSSWFSSYPGGLPRFLLLESGFWVLAFRFLISLHQVPQRVLRRLPLVEDLVQLLRDRHVHLVLPGHGERRLRGPDALDHRMHRAQDLVQLLPLAQRATHRQVPPGREG